MYIYLVFATFALRFSLRSSRYESPFYSELNSCGKMTSPRMIFVINIIYAIIFAFVVSFPQ